MWRVDVRNAVVKMPWLYLLAFWALMLLSAAGLPFIIALVFGLIGGLKATVAYAKLSPHKRNGRRPEYGCMPS